jgi:hypothetical protein
MKNGSERLSIGFQSDIFLTCALQRATIFAQGIHLESIEGTDQTKGVDHGF